MTARQVRRRGTPSRDPTTVGAHEANLDHRDRSHGPETRNGRQETAAASSRPSKQYQRTPIHWINRTTAHWEWSFVTRVPVPSSGTASNLLMILHTGGAR